MIRNSFTPTRERVQSLLDYDPATGVFRWKVDRKGKAKAGTIAGRLNTDGHRQISIDNVRYLAHHLAWLLETGAWPVNLIDHKDLDRDNNAFENLREATCPQNCANQGIRSTNKTGFKGVSKHKQTGRFQAACSGEYLGLFDDPRQAAMRYDAAARERHGEFARTNFS